MPDTVAGAWRNPPNSGRLRASVGLDRQSCRCTSRVAGDQPCPAQPGRSQSYSTIRRGKFAWLMNGSNTSRAAAGRLVEQVGHGQIVRGLKIVRRDGLCGSIGLLGSIVPVPTCRVRHRDHSAPGHRCSCGRSSRQRFAARPQENRFRDADFRAIEAGSGCLGRLASALGEGLFCRIRLSGPDEDAREPRLHLGIVWSRRRRRSIHGECYIDLTRQPRQFRRYADRDALSGSRNVACSELRDEQAEVEEAALQRAQRRERQVASLCTDPEVPLPPPAANGVSPCATSSARRSLISTRSTRAAGACRSTIGSRRVSQCHRETVRRAGPGIGVWRIRRASRVGSAR